MVQLKSFRDFRVWESLIRRGGGGAARDKRLDPEYLAMDNGHQKDSISDGEIRKRDKKDIELDKRIQALKKKNKALMRRHLEIEEDRKNAERGGLEMFRKPTQESLTITITKSPNEKRTVSKSRKNPGDTGEEEPGITISVANKMQLEVTMDNKFKGKQVPAKKGNQDYLQVTKDFSELNMEQVDHLFTCGRGRQMQIVVTVDQMDNKTWNPECIPVPKYLSDLSMEEVDYLLTYGRGRRMQIAVATENVGAIKRDELSGNGRKKAVIKEQKKALEEEVETDLPLTAAEQEHIEYREWKKERAKIDRDRVARQKNARGEWKRAWDVDKTDYMIQKDPKPDDCLCTKKVFLGTENSNLMVNKDAVKTLTAVSSNARGRDRLTGRAQRWGSVDEQDSTYHLDEILTQVPFIEGKCRMKPYLPKPQRKLDDKEKIVCGSLSSGAGVHASPLDKNRRVGYGDGESIEEKWSIPLEEKPFGEYYSGLNAEGIEAIEYLSVLSNDRQLEGAKDESIHQLDKQYPTSP
uniref:Uncharacterized protein n=1 Tax=Leptobrachium leishanense TaxID=445787 RepID=A0A8C5R6F8_9ANUR